MAVAQEAESTAARAARRCRPATRCCSCRAAPRPVLGRPAESAAADATVDYVNTGAWSKKAHRRGQRSRRGSTSPPMRRPRATRTVPGRGRRCSCTRRRRLPALHAQRDHRRRRVPVRARRRRRAARGGHVLDASCRGRSRWRSFGLIYAGAQKNIGPAGLTRGHRARGSASASARRRHACGVGLQGHGAMRARCSTRRRPSPGTSRGWCSSWLKAQGGLGAMGERNRAKAQLLYRRHRWFRLSTATRSPANCRSWMNVPFTLARSASSIKHFCQRGARRRAHQPRRPPLGRRHARQHLQRHAARGRRGAGRVHEGVRAPPRLTRMTLPHSDSEPHQPARPRAPAARALRGRRRPRRSRMRSWCAPPTCTARRSPPACAPSAAPARRQQHPGRRAEQARHPGVQLPGRQCQRGEGAGARGTVAGGAQHLAGVARSRARSAATMRRSRRRSSRARRTSSVSSCPGARSGWWDSAPSASRWPIPRWRSACSVLGYDPQITVQRAWQLSSSVEQALLARGSVRARGRDQRARAAQRPDPRSSSASARLTLMQKERRRSSTSRAPPSWTRRRSSPRSMPAACMPMCATFPSSALKDHPKVVTLPHLGASTGEAEENCAVMVAEQLRDFLENGNIRNSVNYPGSGPAAGAEHDAARASPTATFRTWSARSPPVSPRADQHRGPAEQVARRIRLYAHRHRWRRGRASCSRRSAPSTACCRRGSSDESRQEARGRSEHHDR